MSFFSDLGNALNTFQNPNAPTSRFPGDVRSQGYYAQAMERRQNEIANRAIQQQNADTMRQSVTQEGQANIKLAASHMFELLSSTALNPNKMAVLRAFGMDKLLQTALNAYGQTAADGDESHIQGLDLRALFDAATKDAPALAALSDSDLAASGYTPDMIANFRKTYPATAGNSPLPGPFNPANTTPKPFYPTASGLPDSAQVPHQQTPSFFPTPTGGPPDTSTPDTATPKSGPVNGPPIPGAINPDTGNPAMPGEPYVPNPFTRTVGTDATLAPDEYAQLLKQSGLPARAGGGPVAGPSNMYLPDPTKGYDPTNMLGQQNSPDGVSNTSYNGPAGPGGLAGWMGRMGTQALAEGKGTPDTSTPSAASVPPPGNSGPIVTPPSTATPGPVDVKLPSPAVGGPGGPGEQPITADPNNPANGPISALLQGITRITKSFPDVGPQFRQYVGQIEQDFLHRVYSDPGVVIARRNMAIAADPANNYMPDASNQAQTDYYGALGNAAKGAADIVSAELAPYTQSQGLLDKQIAGLKDLATAVGGAGGVSDAIDKITTAALAPGAQNVERVKAGAAVTTANAAYKTAVDTSIRDQNTADQALLQSLHSAVYGRYSDAEGTADMLAMAQHSGFNINVQGNVDLGPKLATIGAGIGGGYNQGTSNRQMQREQMRQSGYLMRLGPIMEEITLGMQRNADGSLAHPSLYSIGMADLNTYRQLVPNGLTDTDKAPTDQQAIGVALGSLDINSRRMIYSQANKSGDKDALKWYNGGLAAANQWNAIPTNPKPDVAGALARSQKQLAIIQAQKASEEEQRKAQIPGAGSPAPGTPSTGPDLGIGPDGKPFGSAPTPSSFQATPPPAPYNGAFSGPPGTFSPLTWTPPTWTPPTFGH